MKASDPFGRVAQKRELAYSKFRQQLHAAEISDLEQLQGFKARVDQALYKVIGFILLVSLVIALLLPAMVSTVLVLSALFIIWLLVNHFQTRAFIRRFGEELSGQ